MLDLSSNVRYLKGVGPKIEKLLAKIGIETVIDLIYYFPRDWQDFSVAQKISALRLNDTAIIKARVEEISSFRTPRKQILITRVILADASGEIPAVWFSQPYIIKNIKKGEELYFLGKINYDWQNKEKVIQSPIVENEDKILPVYSETAGLNSRYLRKIIFTALTCVKIKEYLPQKIISRVKLMPLMQALREVHFPSSQESLGLAKNRLAFDELLIIALNSQLARQEHQKNPAPKILINKKMLIDFSKSLNFPLTNAQRKTAWEIINNLARNYPMNRLLEGDVGSGKTVVALMAALLVIKNDHQVLWMAPTEILANQHFQTAKNLLNKFNVKIALITSSRVIGYNKKSELIIGTHSLIQKDRKFSKIGLVIIDEQHRFGVKQRAQLVAHGLTVPHFLSMTATPIPRTLALSIYGDLDISVIDEMPPGRRKVITKVIDPANRDKAYQFIKDQIKLGRQAFVICPLIEVGSKQKELRGKLFDLDKKSVKNEFEKLSKTIFPNLKIAMLHGKLSSAKKQKIMADFSINLINILVSTSVVEVGVDIPNASIMMIEGAECFGLAQLHQFRGRVGRGEHQSFCFIFTDKISPKINSRLRSLEKFHDGFRLAEMDLAMRGPGNLAGINQSGLPDLKMAKLSDIILIKRTQQAAQEIIYDGLENYLDLSKKIDTFNKHLE